MLDNPYMLTTAGLVLLLAIVLLFAASCRGPRRHDNESYVPPYIPPYGEYNEFCRWDARRHCNLSDGSEGECVMNGICMPSLMNFIE